MGILGGVFGGMIGFAIGGPIGAAAGAAIGSAVQKVKAVCPHCGKEVFVETGEYNCHCKHCRRDFIKRKHSSSKTQPAEVPAEVTQKQKVQYLFFISTFSLAAKVAMADGVITREELGVIDDFMRSELNLSGEDLKLAKRIFEEAIESGEPFENFAGQCAQLFAGNQRHLKLMLHLLFNISMADGKFHPAEEELIKIAADIFNIDDEEYSRIRAHYVHDNDQYYKMLGCVKTDIDETIKNKYKKLAMEFHPDMIVSKGLPDEFIEFAKQKFQNIQQAYEKIKDERGFK